MSGRQQDYYEEDRPAISNEEIAAILEAISQAESEEK